MRTTGVYLNICAYFNYYMVTMNVQVDSNDFNRTA